MASFIALAYEVAHVNGKELLSATDEMQLFAQVLVPGEEIPEEIHGRSSQFFYLMEGVCQIDIINSDDDRESYMLKPGQSIIVPAGVRHRVINVSTVETRFFTIYSPPH